MARYTGPVCRLCRRETAASKTGEKIKLFLKGDRCFSKKCAVERRGTAPGQKTTGKPARQKISEYGRQLREKQKMRRYYGVLESQFENYFRAAARVPGQTGKTFLQLLERRLDNVVFRLNLASSRAQARQLVTHRHFRVNGRIVNIPSFIVKSGDVISVGQRSLTSPIFLSNLEVAQSRTRPEWLDWNDTEKSARVSALPGREQIDTPVDEQLIVEYYSR
ncbi:MAG TPA: 30S ribosomal protein S4 [Candidatus Baltobacteraceae bacterium]|jgi:small subunit ribosomal protein S4|nr:30S ribosomal protein S4 [Candidatus Baltobacteraceae bacterium]